MICMLKRRKRFTKRGFRLKLKKETAFSISQIFFYALAGLILISFTRQGLILLKFNDILWTYFSWASFILPFIFLSFAFLISKVKFALGQPNVVVGGLLFFVSVMALGRAGDRRNNCMGSDGRACNRNWSRDYFFRDEFCRTNSSF